MPKVRDEDMVLETGLADDFDGTIVDAYFEINPDYSRVSGTTDPMLVLVLESPELDAGRAETRYTCGAAKQWDLAKGGREIVSQVRPDSHVFNMNARAGQVVGRLFSLLGTGDKKKGQNILKVRDYYMTEADFYIGVKTHWKREPMPTVSGDTKEVLMPCGFASVTEVKKDTPTVSTDVEAKIQEIAAGKPRRAVMTEVMAKWGPKGKDPDDAMVKAVFSGGLLKKMEDSGKLALDPDGHYI